MKARTHTACKNGVRTKTSDVPIPAPTAPAHDEAPAPDVATQLGVAGQGHSFGGLSVSAAPAGAIQPKLTVGAADDQYEDEADKVAGQVMRMPDPTVQRALSPAPEDELEDEEERPGGQVMRKAGAGKSTQLIPPEGVLAAQQDDVPEDAVTRQAAQKGVRTPSSKLPYAEQIQKSFGQYGVGQIQAHLGTQATESATAMQAAAYATGSHVVFAGQPDLHTAAHEAAHVVQQQFGVQLSDSIGKVGDPYEKHADTVADLVLSGRSAEELLDTLSTHKPPASGIIPTSCEDNVPSSVQLMPIQMVRMLIPMNNDYTILRGQASDAFKRYTLNYRLNNITDGIVMSIEDKAFDVTQDYYNAYTQMPPELAQINNRIDVLRKYANNILPFNGVNAEQILEQINGTLTNIQIATYNKEGGWRSSSSKKYSLRLITSVQGLTQSFEDVSSGADCNAIGQPYNAHKFGNGKGELPRDDNRQYTAFDIWDGIHRGKNRGIIGMSNNPKDPDNDKHTLYLTTDHYDSFERILGSNTAPLIKPPEPFIAS